MTDTMTTNQNTAADDGDELPPLVVTSFDDMNFLVVDGNPLALDVMERLLKAVAVHGITTSRSAFTAVSMLAKPTTKIDCIICDYSLEGMTGLSFLKRIRAGSTGAIPRDTRFIMAMDQARQDLVEAAIRLDVHGFLTKPIKGAAILKTVHMAFARTIRLKPTASYAKVALPA